jgi:hypothetical protein
MRLAMALVDPQGQIVRRLHFIAGLFQIAI